MMKALFKHPFVLIYPFICIVASLGTSTPVSAQCSTGCTTTLTSSGGSGDLTLEAGDTLCITATSGNLDVDYNEVRLRPGSGIKMCSDPEDTIKFNAEMRFFSGGSGTHCSIVNNGNFHYTFGNLGYSRVNIVNNGHWEVDGNFQQNSTGPPTFKNPEGSTLQVNGTFDISAGEFDNEGLMNITGDLDFNGNDFLNTGDVQVGQELTINSSSTVNLNGGVFTAYDMTLNGGDFAMGVGGCAAFLITNETTVNNSVDIVSGALWITDSTDTDTINTNNCPDVGKTCNGIEFALNNACYVALPIRFVRFYESGNQLYWQITDPHTLGHFEVQQSSDGKEYSTIEVISPYQGATRFGSSKWQTTPPNESGYLRIVAHDLEGSSIQSRVIHHDADSRAPIITKDADTWSITGVEGRFKVRLVSPSGIVLKQYDWSPGMEFPQGNTTGIHLVHLTGEREAYTLKTLFE